MSEKSEKIEKGVKLRIMVIGVRYMEADRKEISGGTWFWMAISGAYLVVLYTLKWARFVYASISMSYIVYVWVLYCVLLVT